MSEKHATLASDEDMEYGFVLVDEAAPTAEAARAAVLAQADSEWGITFERDDDLLLPSRRPYKYEGDYLVPCEPDDSARDSEWWCFALPDWFWSPVSRVSAGGGS